MAIALIGRGNALRAKKDFKGAITDYNRALEIDKRIHIAYGERAKAYYALSDYDQALEDASKALELSPQSAELFEQVGRIHLAKGQFEKAIESFTKALELDPAFAIGYAGLACAKACTGAKDHSSDAATFLKLAGFHHESSADVAIMGYFKLLRSSEPEKAASLLNEALEKCDKASWPYPILQYLHRDLSFQELSKLATDEKKVAKFHLCVGMQLATIGRPGEALDHLRWTKLHADRQSHDYPLSVAELLRIERTAAQPNDEDQSARGSGGE